MIFVLTYANPSLHPSCDIYPSSIVIESLTRRPICGRSDTAAIILAWSGMTIGALEPGISAEPLLIEQSRRLTNVWPENTPGLVSLQPVNANLTLSQYL